MAEAILAQAKKLDAHLESRNIPYPSFDEDTLDRLPDELQDDRWALANSSNELKKIVRGAAMGTLDTAMSVGSSSSPCHSVLLLSFYHYVLSGPMLSLPPARRLKLS